MLFLCLFLLLCLCITILFSPVVFRYMKENETTISLHFVFFSLSFQKKKVDAENSEKGKKKKKTNFSFRSVLSLLRRVLSHSTIHIESLPLPSAATPCEAALLTGGYFFLISLFASRFEKYTSDPLLRTKEKNQPMIDVRIRTSLGTVLYTFLVYMTKYRKEKEKKSYGRNENERHYPNLT